MPNFKDLFSSQSTKPVVGIDIGSYYIKYAESDMSSGHPALKSCSVARTPEGAVNSSGISKPEIVGQAVSRLLSDKKIQTKKISFSLPSSAVFIKKISVSQAALVNLETNIHFEASNYIPHRMDAISLDYYVLDSGSADVSVLLVAVKNDILTAYRKVFESVGLEPAIADVESFSLGNIIEYIHPEYKNEVVLVVDIGHRHTTLSIIDKGVYFSSGDVGVGGKTYSEALLENLKLPQDEIETIKMGLRDSGFDQEVFNSTIAECNERVSSDIIRQLEYITNGVSTSGPISKCIFTGGGSVTKGLSELLSSKLNNSLKINTESLSFDSLLAKENSSLSEEFKKNSSCLANVVSLSSRRFGDKVKKLNKKSS